MAAPPSWFHLKSYDHFENAPEGDTDSFAKLWCNALLLRQHVVREIGAGRIDSQLRQLVARMLADPTNSFGFSTHWSHGTVWSTKATDLYFLTQVPEHETLDDLYVSSLDKLGAIAFVTVNLDANTDVVNGDFSRWLTKIRKHRNVKSPTKANPQRLLHTWARYRVIPYIDTALIWAGLDKKRMARTTVGEWLQPTYSTNKLRDFVEKTLPKATKLALDPRIIQHLTTTKK